MYISKKYPFLRDMYIIALRMGPNAYFHLTFDIYLHLYVEMVCRDFQIK